MIRNIAIRAVANGYVVEVGCQTLVFEHRDALLGELDAYLRDPEGTEKRFLETAVNIKHTMNVPLQCAEASCEYVGTAQGLARDPRR